MSSKTYLCDKLYHGDEEELLKQILSNVLKIRRKLAFCTQNKTPGSLTLTCKQWEQKQNSFVFILVSKWGGQKCLFSPFTQPFPGDFCVSFPRLAVCIKVMGAGKLGVSFDLPLICLRRYYQSSSRGQPQFM